MKTRTIIFLIILIAGAIRVYDIDKKNLWFDEVYSWKISQNNIIGIVSETSGDIHPPFFYIILKYWTTLFSDSVVSMRLLSTLLSLLSMIILYKLSKLFLEKDYQVLIVLLLYAISPLNIYYSQEVRMLNLNLFLCIGSVLFFYKLTQSPSLINSVIYSAFTLLALYTHYFAFLIFFTEIITSILFYLMKKDSLRMIKLFLVNVIVINILYAPWYPVVLSQVSKGQPWRKEQTFIEIAGNILGYFKDMFISIYYNFESNAANYLAIFISFFISAFLLLSLFRLLNSGNFFSDRKNSIILFFFIPLIIASIISLNQSLVMSRYLSILVPFLIIILVYFSFKIYKPVIAFLVMILLIAVSSYGVYIYFNNNFKLNDYRKIISYVESNFHKGDEIIVEPHFMGWSFNYHISHSNSQLKKPEVLGWNLKMQIDSLKKTNFEKVWFITDYSSLEKNNYDSLTFYMNEMGFHKLASKSFYILPSKVSVNYFTKNRDLAE